MTTEWTEEKLQQYIGNEIEENLSLDYKEADSIWNSDGKKKEISKDVSAMANSAGGIIIYGIREFQDKEQKHLPEKLDPVDRTQFSKEWLEQVINSNIQPRIDGILIHSVQLSSRQNDVAYVVEIPQSTTAHQAADKRYYKRFNFLSQAMEDYEIRDIMGRSKHPKIDLKFNFSIRDESLVLCVTAINKGEVYARFVHCTVNLPAIMLTGDEERYKWDFLQRRSDGTYFYIRSFNNEENGAYHPILPSLEKFLGFEEISQSTSWKLDPNSRIDWTVYADNAAPRSGTTYLTNIPTIDV